MADIQFNEPQYGQSNLSGPRRSWLTSLVIKTGLATDGAGAQKVLLIVLALAVIATIAVIALSGGSTPPPLTDPGM